MKSKDKSSEQRFGHVNATNPNSYLNIFIKLVTQLILKKNTKKPKFFNPTSTALVFVDGTKS